MNPSTGDNAELVMPFVNPRNYMNLSPTGLSGEYARTAGFNMGRLYFTEYVPLAMANNAGAANVEYSLYLWMTDV